ncbi:DUF3861 family protein [Lysobacter silvisoli]|uniref:DUF3861 family protein n=1 Tax=Lysobacter silvisoli TaxID=2293254 RepID=A0A371K2B8_9GAMM|nr:DUF3861 family protein [Lysobacter silvisoli]RDZ28055.1 DUF3861 family protein [Lysobacter silvisoli]
MNARAHRYRIRVDPLDHAVDPALDFEASQHDDLLAIAARLRAAALLPEQDAAALALGLKLFAGVALTHRQDPLFAAIQPALRAFIGQLKARVATALPSQPTPGGNR